MGGVIRYGNVLGGKQLPLFKTKSSLMDCAGGREVLGEYLKQFTLLHTLFRVFTFSISPIHRLRLQ